jgi:hypothetical protein
VPAILLEAKRAVREEFHREPTPTSSDLLVKENRELKSDLFDAQFLLKQATRIKYRLQAKLTLMQLD